MAVDDAYTKALLHFDGVDGSTTFTDESGKTWVGQGSPALTTSDYKFATASLSNAIGGIYSAGNADWNFGSGDFTIDFWIKSTTTTQYATLCAKSAGFSTGMWSLLTSNSAAGDLTFYCYEYSNSTYMLKTAGGLFNTGAWVHVALVRNGSAWTIYVDGQEKATQTSTITIADANISLGIGLDLAYGRSINGLIDEFRLSKGIARWTAPFTPPSAPYAPTASDNIIYGATLLTEIMPASAPRTSGALLLVEMTDMPAPFGIIPTTLQARSTAATLRTKRKTYATLNERSTAITLEERP